jgi:hypothetical protein
MYFKFIEKNIVQIEIKTYNIDENRVVNTEYGSRLDLSKNTLSIRNSCNSKNDDFKKNSLRKMKGKTAEYMKIYK